jgi:microcystin-dependent protein
MSTPFLGEIKVISFDFAPRGWALCNGQLLPINQNQALIAILGTIYGGNGQTTFALPDFRGRSPLHQGNGFSLGQAGGAESHTLTAAEMATHSHRVNGSDAAADLASPAGNAWGKTTKLAYNTTPNAEMATAITAAGEGQAHHNMPPYLVLNFVISLQGIFPSRN